MKNISLVICDIDGALVNKGEKLLTKTKKALIDIHKGKGVKWLKNIYNLNDDDCIAIGDNDPDIMMFKECKDKIAMGNASDNCKKEATFITKDINENGIFLAFKYLNLI